MAGRSSTAPSGAQRLAAALAGSPLFWVTIIGCLFAWPVVRSLRAEGALPPPLPVLGTVPPFHLKDQYGQPFGSDQLRGKVWIAQFLRTRSSGSMTDRMSELQHRTRALGEAFHLVSFTIDPRHDTRPVLGRYSNDHRVSRRAWSFLTGPPATVEAALRQGFALDITGDMHAHLSRFALVDRNLKVRGYYDLKLRSALDRVLRDAGLLVNRGD
jgi:protein SCO1/2